MQAKFYFVNVIVDLPRNGGLRRNICNDFVSVINAKNSVIHL